MDKEAGRRAIRAEEVEANLCKHYAKTFRKDGDIETARRFEKREREHREAIARLRREYGL